MNRAGKMSFASSPLHPYWLYVQTASYKIWIQGVFYLGVNHSEHEAGKKTSRGVLRMSEVSLNIPWHREQNI